MQYIILFFPVKKVFTNKRENLESKTSTTRSFKNSSFFQFKIQEHAKCTKENEIQGKFHSIKPATNYPRCKKPAGRK